MSARDELPAAPGARDHRLDDLLTVWAEANSEFGRAGALTRFLLGLYDGQRFRFDLTNLRYLDGRQFAACLNVLALDWAQPDGVHVHLAKHTGMPHMAARFELLAHDWRLPNCCTNECAAKMRAGLRAKAGRAAPATDWSAA